MTRYALVIFDLDGTLTSLRLSPVHDAPLIPLPNVMRELTAFSADAVTLALATNQITGRFRGHPYTNAVIGERLDDLAVLLPMLPRHLMRVGKPGTEDWKPRPGMLVKLLEDSWADRQSTLFVGDSESDRRAADNASVAFRWAWDFFSWPNGQADRSIDWRARGSSIWRKAQDSR